MRGYCHVRTCPRPAYAPLTTVKVHSSRLPSHNKVAYRRRARVCYTPLGRRQHVESGTGFYPPSKLLVCCKGLEVSISYPGRIILLTSIGPGYLCLLRASVPA